ncbi:clathrin light chain A-like isoform X2 [Leucoraja erinacea]|uniref:clathrin light chain A-like isoform X2 n=1 Tax=Leucoraja erinaceus TaxID=7782 RepID=UPI0024573A04|nr:clathrin light chain A-like isoform X2 [Leucoraja erinacea]
MEDVTGTSPLHDSPPEAEHVPEPLPPAGPEEDGEVDTVNSTVTGDSSQGSVADLYAAISEVDGLCQEPDSIRTWREEQVKHLEALDENSREAELEWREKAKRELEDWYTQQEEQLEGMKTNNRTLDEAFYKQPFADVIGYVADDVAEDVGPDLCSGSDWERVLHLCDLNSKSSKPTKDVSRMRSVLLSLSQVPVPLK